MQTQSAMNTPYNSEEAQQKTNTTQVIIHMVVPPSHWVGSSGRDGQWHLLLPTTEGRSVAQTLK